MSALWGTAVKKNGGAVLGQKRGASESREGRGLSKPAAPPPSVRVQAVYTGAGAPS
ncbi:MAG: hypothetical protein QOH95_117 [Gaiellaceae bacterium]|jgi:hypothetical protein|nr:hypothetical protein [Gaiellaceae bacterium]